VIVVGIKRGCAPDKVDMPAAAYRNSQARQVSNSVNVLNSKIDVSGNGMDMVPANRDRPAAYPGEAVVVQR